MHTAAIWTDLRAGLRARWRAYLRIPRWLRWPGTAVVVVLVAVIGANLLGAASRSVVEDTFMIDPGDSTEMQIAIGVGRETEVRWEVLDYSGETRDAFPIAVSLAGPADPITHSEAAGIGVFRFKGGFTRSDFVLRMENRHSIETLPVVVRWTIR